MIEVALALLVIAIGMVSLLGLFTTGLAGAQRADSETQASFFAQTVFNNAKWELRRDWEADFIELGDDANIWQSEGGGPARITFGDRGKVAFLQDINGDTVETWYNYDIRRENSPDFDSDMHTIIRMRVWPGEFPDTSPDKAIYFYTEFYRMD